jgi:hypothetical protein
VHFEIVFHCKCACTRLFAQHTLLLNINKMSAMANWNFILCSCDWCLHFNPLLHCAACANGPRSVRVTVLKSCQISALRAGLYWFLNCLNSSFVFLLGNFLRLIQLPKCSFLRQTAPCTQFSTPPSLLTSCWPTSRTQSTVSLSSSWRISSYTPTFHASTFPRASIRDSFSQFNQPLLNAKQF